MALKRTVVCDVCNKEYTDKSFGSGFPDWMQVNGILLDGNAVVWFCVEHKALVADFIDKLKNS